MGSGRGGAEAAPTHGLRDNPPRGRADTQVGPYKWITKQDGP